MDEPTQRGRQVVGGILPDQEDTGGNYSQSDSSGGPGDRPTVRPYTEPSDVEAGRPEPPDAGSGPSPDPDEPVDRDVSAAPDALPPDLQGE